MGVRLEAAMKHKEQTHVVARDVRLGSGDTVLREGTKVALLSSRKEADGTWSALVSVNGRWNTTGCVPADSIKRA